MECKFSLKSFGISVDRLPTNLEIWKWSHSIDMKYHRKWLKMREAKEAAIRAAIIENDNNDNKIGNDTNSSIISQRHGVMAAVHRIRSKFVECPRHEDCLFGKGASVMSHPGNVAMRRLLNERYERFEHLNNPGKDKLAMEIVDEIKRGAGRFLKEDVNNNRNYTDTNSNTGLFIEVDEVVARKKIVIAFRDLKKKRMRQKQKEEEKKQKQELQELEPIPCKVATATGAAKSKKKEPPKQQKNNQIGIKRDTNAYFSSDSDVSMALRPGGSIFDVVSLESRKLSQHNNKKEPFSSCFETNMSTSERVSPSPARYVALFCNITE